MDKEMKYFSVYNRLLRKYKRYVSMAKDVGLPKLVKLHVRDQFQHLAETFLSDAAVRITYADMHSAGILCGKSYTLCLKLGHRQSHSKSNPS